MNQRTLRRAACQFKTLSEDEIEDLEDEVINFFEAGANLVPPRSLLAPAEIGYVQLVCEQKFLHSRALGCT